MRIIKNNKLKIGLYIFSALLSLSLISAMLPASQKQKNLRTYIVKEGDTLYGIAKKHSVSVADIISHNSRISQNQIFSGQSIQIPSSGASLESFSDQDKTTSLTIPRGRMLLTEFSKRKQNYSLIAMYQCPVGHQAISIINGKYIRKGVLRGLGPYIVIRNGSGTESIITGLTQMLISEGNWIKRGDVVGSCQNRPVGYMVIQNGKPVNPALLSEN